MPLINHAGFAAIRRRDREVMSAIKPQGRFEAGVPKVLFQLRPDASRGDMTADAQRSLFEVPSSSSEQPFDIVLNWPATLERR